MLAALLYDGIRREEFCLPRIRDMQSRQGVMHSRIKGKRDKIRFVPIQPMVSPLIVEYLELWIHDGERDFDLNDPLFAPVVNNALEDARGV